MPKGYWIAHVDVADPAKYEDYKAANAVAFAKFGARFMVRAGASTQKEGSLRSRHVVIEFPDYQTALDCYDSPEYQKALAIRGPISDGDMVIVEGYDP